MRPSFFITVFMRLVFIRRRIRFQQRLRLLTIRGRRRRTEAYFLHSQRKICRRRKVAWDLERPQFWFEHMLLNQYANNIWREHFRISRQTFQFVCNLVRPHLVRQDTKELISYVSWMLCFSSVKRKETHLPALTALGSLTDLEGSLSRK